MTTLREAVASGPTLVLDGAIGTEIARRGFSTDRPGWAAAATFDAPDMLRTVYRDYVAAGADVVTTNTFRTHDRSSGTPDDGYLDELVNRAVSLVRDASPRFVIGSAGPLEDCYSPELTPDDTALAREHSARAERLAAAGADGLLLETMPTYREAASGLRAGLRAGLTTWVSLWSADGRVLGDGVSLIDAAKRLANSGADVVLLNCFPAEDVGPILESIRAVVPRVGAYANTGRRCDGGWETTSAADPATYASLARKWLDLGAVVVGGCCMTTPSHIRAVRSVVDSLTTREPTP